LRNLRKLMVVATTVALLASLAVPVTATAPVRDGMGRAPGGHSDNLPNPLADAQYAARQKAIELVLNGKATPKGANRVVDLSAFANGGGRGNRVHYHRPNQFVELAQTGEDKIFTVLGQFGNVDANHTSHNQVDSLIAGEAIGAIQHDGADGPLHNQIAKPDRHVDNTTIWTADFSKAYFKDLLFSRATNRNSMANFYSELSSGAYSVSGDVTNWVTVPNNAASYGGDYCGDIVCTDTWLFVNDSVDAWTAASGKTTAQLNAYLAQFDVWDRYDRDGDMNFNEPDGYIDHFQSVHAGQGEEVGGGDQGEDAIWSHRWYTYFFADGPDGAGPGGLGGLKIGNTNYWIGDYTIEPENGGVGVFSHEFGHDLGLPDMYDTSGGENSTAWWTLMSQGSYGTGNLTDIGSKPIPMGAWEKLVLGWEDPAVYDYTDSATVTLGPSIRQSKNGKQSLVVLLPDKEVTTDVGDPPDKGGSAFFYSSAGNNLDNLMYREVNLGATPSLTAQVNYETEAGFDFWYVVVSADGGATWQVADPNLADAGTGFGVDGTSNGLWVSLTADLTPWHDQKVLVGLRYVTDGSVAGSGLRADNITIGGAGPFGAEVPNEFIFAPPTGGFHITSGQDTASFFNAYIAEFRQYNGYDEGLKTSPYNFGFLDNPLLQNWTERFQYQKGLLIWYLDESFDDNNTSEHPGGGLILPIDAHQSPLFRLDNFVWRCRIQAVDSPFGTARTDRLVLHRNSQRQVFASLPGVPVFNDNLSYWNAASPLCGTQVPHTGTTIRATSVNGFYMKVYLNE
jgi:immune inhibitor A